MPPIIQIGLSYVYEKCLVNRKQRFWGFPTEKTMREKFIMGLSPPLCICYVSNRKQEQELRPWLTNRGMGNSAFTSRVNLEHKKSSTVLGC